MRARCHERSFDEVDLAPDGTTAFCSQDFLILFLSQAVLPRDPFQAGSEAFMDHVKEAD